jgi:hypothetical protein
MICRNNSLGGTVCECNCNVSFVQPERDRRNLELLYLVLVANGTYIEYVQHTVVKDLVIQLNATKVCPK